MKHFLSLLGLDVNKTLCLTVGSPSGDRRRRQLKHITFMLLFLLGSLNVWGEEQVAYTLEPTSGSNNSYTGNCDVEIDGITWNLTGNSQQKPWRIGGKSLSGVNREVYSKTAMSDAITKVELTVGAASSITVNSVKLIVASNDDFSTIIDEVSENFSANSTITFNPTTPVTQWATGAYYKFVFNVSVSGTSNKFVEFTRAKFYTEEGSGDVIVKTLESIAVEGMTTSYDQFASFSFDGTCTATYSVTIGDVEQDDEEKEVTPTSVTSPDMSTTGVKEVTVSFTDDNVTKTAKYDITVNEHVVTPGEYTINLNNTLYGVSTGNNAAEQSASQKDITVVSGCTSSASSKTNYDTDHIRYYADSYLHISVPSGYQITSIVFTSGGTWNGGITTNVGTYDADNKSWSGKAQEVDFAFSAQDRIATVTVTYAEVAPEVTVDPTSLSFDAKQNIAVEGKMFTLTGANLTSGLKLVASEGFTVSPESITAADAMAQGGVEVTVTPAIPTETTTPVEGTVTISGDGLANDVEVALSMAVTPTYAVGVAVNENAMGSATMDGGTASVYKANGETVALVATPASGHEFVSWTATSGISFDNANNPNATATITAAGTITANFQAQACTGLAAPVLDEVTTTYQSATIAWEAVANADGYVLNLKKHEGNVAVVTNELIVAPAVSFEKTGLEANTQYDYSVMAVGDGTSFCDESNPLLEGNFTTNDYPAATLTLSEVGAENDYTWGSGLKLNSEIALPSSLQHSEGCSGKVLVGWSSVAIAEPGDEPTANYWEAGADYTMLSTADKLYAVYATATGGAGDSWVINTSNFDKAGSGSGYALYNGDHTLSGITYNTSNVMLQSSKIQFKSGSGVMYNKTEFSADIVSIEIDGISSNITVYEGDEEISTGGTAVTLADGVYPFSAGKRFFRIKMGSATGQANSITVNLAGALSYSDYTTACEAALPVLGAPTFGVAEGVFYENTDITISAAEGASIYYTTDGTTPSSTNGTLYEGAITLSEYGTYNFKAIAVQAGHEDSEVAEATYAIGKVFASVSDLYSYLEAESLTSMNNVKVTGLVSRITYAWDAQKGYLTYYISDNGQAENDLQMYRGAGTGADALAVGDQVTVTGNYTLFQSTTHEFAAGNTIVARTAAAVTSVAIGGAAEKTTYSPEDNVFSRAGLTATVAYNTGYTKDVTADATWTNNLTNDIVTETGKVTVTATYGDKNDTKEVDVTYTSKTLDHITLSYASITVYEGMALPTPTVTASYVEDIAAENVTELVAAANGFDTESAYDGSVAGTYTINVSYTLGTVTKNAEYTVTVKSVYNSENEPYSVAQALEIIGALFNTTTASADSIVVTGKVSRLDDTYVNTYWISDDGNTNNELEVYSGKYLNKANFTAQNQLHVGDEVVVKGKVKTYNNTREFDSNSRLVSLAREAEVTVANVAELEVGQADLAVEDLTITTLSEGAVTLVSGDEKIATIVDHKIHAVAAGEVTITANVAANGIYKAASAEFTVNVVATKDRYTVTFDANGGTGTDPVIANQLPGATVDLPENPYSKANSAFDAWVVNDGAVEITDGHFTMPEGNVTIKATWNVVATCAISFMVNGAEVATTANAPQTAAYSLAEVYHPTVPGFTWVGWSETEYAEEVENAPATITSYTPAAEEATKVLYGIYSRLDNSDANYGKYEKATAVAEGDYLIVCEDENVVFDGSLATLDATSNTQAATISDGVLTLANADNYVFTIAAMTGGYSIKSASNKYIGNTGTKNGLTATADEILNQVSISNGNAVITSGSTNYLKYNKTSGQERFRYFNSNSQESIQLYKKNLGTTYYTSSPAEKVTITFDANGGEGGCQNAIINKGSQLTICAEKPTKTHSDFTGWNSQADGEGTAYAAGEEHTFNADVTLYAQWTDAQKYTVTYAAGGATGDVPTEENQYAGDAFDVAAKGTLVKSGYDFQGWKYDGKLYAAEASFTMPASAVEFVAQWKKQNISTETMTLVTDANALVDGMQVVLGYQGEAESKIAGEITGNNNKKEYFSAQEATIIDNQISIENAVIMTLHKVANGWLLSKDESNYLTISSNNINWDAKEKAAIWAITISNSNATIKNGDNWIQYNSSNPRFKTYSSTQKSIMLFGKSLAITNNASISDLGYVEGDVIVVNEGVQLTMNEPSAPASITVKDGATVTISAETEADNLIVENGGKVTVSNSTTVNDLIIGSTMASGKSGQINGATNINFEAVGDVYFDLTLGAGGTSAQWHAFTVPFPVDALNGVYDLDGNKLTNEVNYAIMDYHGDIRAEGKYGWKKYRGILQPGTFYLMTVDGERTTYRFKKVAGADIVAGISKQLHKYASSTGNNDNGWNGVGNPTLMYGTVDQNVQVLNPVSYTYEPYTAGNQNFVVGTPFFVQAANDGEMTMGAVVGDKPYYAPARQASNEIKDVKVTFGNEEFRDKLYISTSEDALNEYETGKDLVKMTMTSTPKVAQIFGEAYNAKLCMVNTPMVNDQAEVALSLYAPAAGEYTIAAPEETNAYVYLTKDGVIIWNLSNGEYTADMKQGNNEGYGIRIVKAPNATTGIGNAEVGEAGVQKVVIDNNVYILRGEKMYDATGRMVK